MSTATDLQNAMRSNPRDGLLQNFVFDELPDNQKAIAESYAALAVKLMVVPEGYERSVALRMLLESKDAAVAACRKGNPPPSPT